EIVVVERRRESRHLGGNASIAIGDRDVPVVPAVVAAADDARTPGVSAGQANGGARYVPPPLAEPDVFSARDDLAYELRHLDLERMHERKRDAVVELRSNRFVHRWIAVAKGQWANRHVEVEVLVTVDIPDVGPFTPREVFRGNAFHVLFGAL